MELLSKRFDDKSLTLSPTSSHINQTVHTKPSTDTRKVSFLKIPSPNIAEVVGGGEGLIEHYLESIVLQNSGLTMIRNHKTLLRLDHESMSDKVKIMSGGQTSFEPLYSGFIGPGMVTAAVFGELTSSPTYLSILTTLRILGKHHHRGILVIVMNNLADRLNFGLACQQAAHEGIKTMCLTVGEDCSGVSVNKQVGRRGLCGIMFLLKVAGAMSEDKKTLYEMFCVLTALKGGSVGTVNVGMQDVMTIGPGLKGEAGKYVSQLSSIQQVVKEALFFILSPASYFSLHVVKGDDIAIVVNNLGKLSDFHLSLIAREVIKKITALGINVVRIYSGRFLTSSTPMAFSISVLKVTKNVLKWLDFPVNVMNWPKRVNQAAESSVPFTDRCLLYVDKTDSHLSVSCTESTFEREEKSLGPKFTLEQAMLAVKVLKGIVKAIVNMEEHLNKLDSDHDFGTSMKTFMLKVKSTMEFKTLNILTPFGLLNDLAKIAACAMEGVSGGVYSILFSAASQKFLTSSSHGSVTWDMWMQAARLAQDSLCLYSHVSPGDRTVLDALHPFVQTFTTPTVRCLYAAVEAAMKGAQNTATMMSKWDKSKHPDAGAYALAVALRVMVTELQIELLEAEGSLCSECTIIG